MRFAQHPRVGDLHPDGTAARNRSRRVLREGPVGVIDGNLRDLHRLRPARTHKNLDAAVLSRIVRSTVSDSTGGAPLLKSRNGLSEAIKTKDTRMAARGRNTSRSRISGEQSVGSGRSCPRPPHVEHADPAQLGELGLMGVEHVHAVLMVGEAELEDAALRLALHDQIDRAQGRRQLRASVVVVEEIRVQVGTS